MSRAKSLLWLLVVSFFFPGWAQKFAPYINLKGKTLCLSLVRAG